MKNEHIVLDELSAYLDGEARDSARVEAHLRTCAQCARQFEELSKLSTHMQRMAAPEPSVGFSSRVVAAARESGNPRPRFGLAPWAAGLAACAVFAIAAWVVSGSYVEPAETRSSGGPVEDDALAELESRMEDEDAILEVATWVEEEPMPEANGNVLMVMADAGWFDVSDDANFWEDDFDSSLLLLDEDEQAVFKELLIAEYMPEEESL